MMLVDAVPEYVDVINCNDRLKGLHDFVGFSIGNQQLLSDCLSATDQLTH